MRSRVRRCVHGSVNKLLLISCRGMSAKAVESEALEKFFSPPASVRGTTVLNREDFRREVPLPAIRLHDASLCGRFMQRLPHALLRFPPLKRVVNEIGQDGKVGKLVLLMPNEVTKGGSLSEEDRAWIKSNGGEETTHVVTLDYSHFSIYAMLRAILPAEQKEVPTGFEAVGHVAHFNLREEHLPFKNIIDGFCKEMKLNVHTHPDMTVEYTGRYPGRYGQVILDKQSNIRTVVNKTNQIDDTFRFFKMEVLAGEDDLMATVKENGCTFTFDFSKVYWNSRLHAEHERLVKEIKKEDVVVDVFAGVGPFAIPAAKKGCIVYANDLNPHSHEYLCANAKKNGVTKKLKAYNLDGREFIQKVFNDELLQPPEKPNQPDQSKTQNVVNSRDTHIIMNLPATAVEFLDTFKGLFSSAPPEKRDHVCLPRIHCYCFSKSEASPEDDALQMVVRNLGISALPDGTYTTHNVRKVAPNKTMLRVTFHLPPEVAFNHNQAVGGRVSGSKKEEETCRDDTATDNPSAKRRRLS